MLGYVLRRTDPEEANDVIAETFTVAWRRLEQVPEGDGALPWLRWPSPSPERRSGARCTCSEAPTCSRPT
ncbi:MAG TPA: hypothetical protein VIE12_10530 [Actinomycetota bacterium]